MEVDKMRLFIYLFIFLCCSSCTRANDNIDIVIPADYYGPIYLIEKGDDFNNYNFEENGLIFFTKNPNLININYHLSDRKKLIIAKGAWKKSDGLWEAAILDPEGNVVRYNLEDQSKILKKYNKTKIIFSFENCNGKIEDMDDKVGCLVFNVSDTEDFAQNEIPTFLYEDLRGYFTSLEQLNYKLSIALKLKKIYYGEYIDIKDRKKLLKIINDEMYKPSNNKEFKFFNNKLTLEDQ